MTLEEQLQRQRVKHIVTSYHLAGDDADAFVLYLHALLDQYPAPLIELALVEVLVTHWLAVPLLRGCEFLVHVHDRLRAWEEETVAHDSTAPTQASSLVHPKDFQHITGLDPTPIFGQWLPYLLN
jgi:hypothetical protein